MIETKFKETEVGRVPADWAIYSFDKTFTFFSNNTLSREKLEEKGEMFDVHYGDVLIKYGSVLDAESESIPSIKKQYAYKTTNTIIDGDIIIADTAEDETVGKACEIQNVGNKTIVSGLHTMWVRPQDGQFAPKYLGYAMNGAIYHNQVLPLIQGTKVCSVSKTAIKDTYIIVPPFPEQRRIATVLSDVDSLISSLDELIEKKRNIKQGAMQQLLTGKTRLNGFTEPWEEKKLGEILCIGNGRDYKHLPHGPVPVFGTGGLMAYVDNYLYDGETVCIGRKGTIDEPQYHKGKIWTVDTLFYTYGFKSVNVKLLYYLFTTLPWKSFNEATGVPSLTSKNILNIEVFLPPLPEQRAIASILTSMDDEIAVLEQKREKYVAIKQGMMQELLTGRIRLV